MEKLEAAGITLDASTVQVNFEQVMERVRKNRAGISHHDSAERFSKELGVNVFLGRGKFTAENKVQVNGKTLTFRKAVIATGGYPSLIPLPGLKELHAKATAIDADEVRPLVMTNETVFNMTRAPKHLVVNWSWCDWSGVSAGHATVQVPPLEAREASPIKAVHASFQKEAPSHSSLSAALASSPSPSDKGWRLTCQ